MKQSSEPILRAPIIAIVIFELAALFVRAYFEVRLIDGGESKAFAQDLSYLVVPPILAVLMYPIFRKHRPFLRSLLRPRDLTLRIVVLSVLLGITLRVTYWGGLISLISFGALRNTDPDAVVGPIISFGCPATGVIALGFLVVSLLIPVIEEVINRGLIFHALIHHGTIPAIVVSSLLFALVHDPQAIALAFAFGAILCVQFLNYKTLWATMITHASYNGMTVFDWKCMSAKWNPQETTPNTIGIGLIAAALALVGTALSIVLVIRKRHRGT